MMKNEEIEKETGDLYADCFVILNEEQWFQQGRLLADQLGLDQSKVEGRKCLDGGCGHGSLVFQLSSLGASSVVGVDLHPSHPEEKFRDLDNVKIYKTSLMSLPLDNNSFDLVVSSGVLHHTVNPEQGFREMVRILKPGGTFVLGVYGKHGIFSYCLSLARIFTVRIPIIPKRFVDWFTRILKMDPIWRYQFLDYLYVPILRRYSVKEVIKSFFEANGLKDAHRVSNISADKAQFYNQNKTSFSYDHRKLINKILFGYGFIVVEGYKK
jgi:ubiquinone/menaquinone biosynthesis C-methylase UbiE